MLSLTTRAFLIPVPTAQNLCPGGLETLKFIELTHEVGAQLTGLVADVVSSPQQGCIHVALTILTALDPQTLRLHTRDLLDDRVEELLKRYGPTIQLPNPDPELAGAVQHRANEALCAIQEAATAHAGKRIVVVVSDLLLSAIGQKLQEERRQPFTPFIHFGENSVTVRTLELPLAPTSELGAWRVTLGEGPSGAPDQQKGRRHLVAVRRQDE